MFRPITHLRRETLIFDKASHAPLKANFREIHSLGAATILYDPFIGGKGLSFKD